MALEIERKYLVKNDTYKEMSTTSTRILQGYLSRDPERTVRVRVKGEMGFITVKGITRGATRLEFEYEIPIADAEAMLKLCIPPVIDKIRYIVPFRGYTWEVDEFAGHRAGLVTAEIELSSESEAYSVPSFIGQEVTGNPAYYNSSL